MQNNRLAIPFLLANALLAIAQPLCAHHGPTEVIESLTTRIQSGEQTPELLVRRGDEYRVLGNNKLAIADYRAALEQNEKYPSAIYGLAQAQLAQQDYEAALKISQLGIHFSTSLDQAAPFHALVARAHDKKENYQAASAAWSKALASTNPEVDWYLAKANSLTQMGNHQAARQSLEAAIKNNPSAVLHRAWLDSLIQCGDIQTAAPHIEAGLLRSRWKSSWLLLRARLHLSQSDLRSAQHDAQLALQEINSRQIPNTPNPFLISAEKQSQAILQRCLRTPASP